MYYNIQTYKDYCDFITYLKTISDTNYRSFLERIIPGDYDILGIRVPELRKIAKEIFSNDYISFLNNADSNIHEMKLIEALVISKIKDIETYKQYFENFILKIDNWALCDTFIGDSKIIKSDLNYFWIRALQLINLDSTYMKRIGYVILLNYFITNEYIDKLLKVLKDYKSYSYYTDMAYAWLVSFIFINYPEKCKQFILSDLNDIKIYKLTQRKILDSYKVSNENKEWIKSIKKDV